MQEIIQQIEDEVMGHNNPRRVSRLKNEWPVLWELLMELFEASEASAQINVIDIGEKRDLDQVEVEYDEDGGVISFRVIAE